MRRHRRRASGGGTGAPTSEWRISSGRQQGRAQRAAVVVVCAEVDARAQGPGGAHGSSLYGGAAFSCAAARRLALARFRGSACGNYAVDSCPLGAAHGAGSPASAFQLDLSEASTAEVMNGGTGRGNCRNSYSGVIGTDKNRAVLAYTSSRAGFFIEKSTHVQRHSSRYPEDTHCVRAARPQASRKRPNTDSLRPGPSRLQLKTRPSVPTTTMPRRHAIWRSSSRQHTHQYSQGRKAQTPSEGRRLPHQGYGVGVVR